ncbi:MAG: hypothetical protein QS98_C0001G0012 [archaeon GW2011_AR3]|nr:MAG: hypothetical protein QS98_C0001G0012 [archaeon GW2011_AR3]MBS3109290.1 hypothetical protein [Candidatus Woesearchaeota archaeon]
MAITNVELYQGDRKLVQPVVMTDLPKEITEYISGFGAGKGLRMINELEIPEGILPTPAQTFYKMNELYDLYYQAPSKHKTLGKAFGDGLFLTGHVIRIVNGQPYIGTLDNLANGYPDGGPRHIEDMGLDKMEAVDGRIFKQGKGQIVAWEIVGEYKTRDGKTEYFALPLVGENGQRSVDYESFQDPFNILGFEHGKLMSINQDLFNRYRIIAVLDRGKFIEANPGVSLEDVAKAGPKSFPPVEKVERIPH